MRTHKPLTKEEAVAARDCALRYPAERGGQIFHNICTGSYVVALKMLRQGKTCVEYGGPAVAVAVVRGELKWLSIIDAVDDLSELIGSNYIELLDSDPLAVAGKLQEYIDDQETVNHGGQTLSEKTYALYEKVCEVLGDLKDIG